MGMPSYCKTCASEGRPTMVTRLYAVNLRREELCNRGDRLCAAIGTGGIELLRGQFGAGVGQRSFVDGLVDGLTRGQLLLFAQGLGKLHQVKRFLGIDPPRVSAWRRVGGGTVAGKIEGQGVQ